MAQITNELADKVLTANVRNIIQKVQDGGRLTAGEIKIFEQYTIEQTELHRSRQAALIRRWSAGGRLTEEEKQEICDIIPALEIKPVETFKASYKKEQKQYAALFSQSDRTIKRWIAKGRSANDLPPLDCPAEMPAWWARNYKHRVPEGILKAASESESVPVKKTEHSASSRHSGSEGMTIGTGFSEMLKRVKVAEAEASREYLEAVKLNPDDPRIPALRKTWSEFSKQLRELERDSHEILSKGDEIIDKQCVEKIIAEIHGPIVNGIRSMYRRVKNRIEATTSTAEKDKIWQAECDRLFARLNESKFLAYE